MKQLATSLVGVLSWIPIGVEFCQRVDQIPACSVNSLVVNKLLQNLRTEPVIRRASCSRALVDTNGQQWLR